MGDMFEKLLLINEIISEEELEFYKKIQSTSPRQRHLGEILLEKGIRPVTQVSIDKTWSALRFRPTEAVGR